MLPGDPTDTGILNRTRILVLDDDPLQAETWMRILPGRVEVEANAAQGLARLRRDADLRIVITDLGLREGGIPLLKTIHRRFPDHVVIVLGKASPPMDPELARDLGVFRALVKRDASFADLVQVVKDAIGFLRVKARAK